MLRRLRETAPGLLVPLAWTFVAAAHVGLVAERTLTIAHVVMSALLFSFAVLSWSEMREGILLAWRRVIAVGFVPTVGGTVGLAYGVAPAVTLPAAVYAWMLLPAAALAYTGREADRAPAPYTIGGLLSATGAVVYTLGSPAEPGTGALVGLALVGIGQTAGILNAVYQY